MQHFQFALLAPHRGAGALIANDLGRSDEATAARVGLAGSQTPGAHCRLSTAVAPASPQAIALVPLRCQLAENLAAPQRR